MSFIPSPLRRSLIRWTAWHNGSPARAGGFVLVMSLVLSAVAYILGALAQRQARDDSPG
jgi:hypothetical protein